MAYGEGRIGVTAVRGEGNMITLIASLALGGATPLQTASAPFLRGNWFVRNCDTSTWQLACGSYILGYFHGSEALRTSICVPEGVDTGQLIEVALSYMRRHPERGHLVGTMLIDEAWKEAFSCRR